MGLAEMDMTTVLGVVAGAITTTSFLPQVVKTWRSKRTQDISIFTFTLLLLGVALWFAYGIIRKDFPVVLANGVSFVLVFLILYLKIKHG